MKVARGRTYLLSELTVDANINMAGYKLTNLGAGSGDGQSIRHQQLTAAITTHKGDASAHHAKYTGAEAVTACEADTDLLNPSGQIILWHGTIANIPSGWLICDGNNSTPDLLAKFVQGVATAATDPGAGGGATAKTTAGHDHSLNNNTTATTGLESYSDYRVSYGSGMNSGSIVQKTASDTDSIADIRPLFYDVAFLMKS